MASDNDQRVTFDREQGFEFFDDRSQFLVHGVHLPRRPWFRSVLRTVMKVFRECPVIVPGIVFFPFGPPKYTTRYRR